MRANEDEFLIATPQQSRVGRLFDRLDRAIVRLGRAIWRDVIDGFAAYGMAECPMLIDTRFCNSPDQASARPHDLAIPSMPAAADLRGDFETLDDLVRALQTARHQTTRQ
jgi:hypothetical protein